MLRIRKGFDFAHSPEIVWGYLKDFEGWGRWWPNSYFRITELGDANHVGLQRLVTHNSPVLPFPTEYTEEVTGVSKHRRLEFRVIRGLSLNHHYEIISLEPVGNGTRLSWRINFESRWPGVGFVLKKLWQENLDAALVRLDRLMRAEFSLEGKHFAGSTDIDPTWHSRALESHQKLRKAALKFKQTGANHYWFARSYQNVQEAMLSLVSTGHFIHPNWVLQLLVVWHEIYHNNLELWESGQHDKVEYHWVEAFEAAEVGPRWWKNAGAGVGHALARAAWAHICEDMPRALAIVYHDYYADTELDYEVFREDFHRLHAVFEVGQRWLKREMPQTSMKNWVFARFLPENFYQSNVHKPFFDIRRERRRAWNRGKAQLRLLSDPNGKQGERLPEIKTKSQD